MGYIGMGYAEVGDTEEMKQRHKLKDNEASWRGRKETTIINSNLL